MQWRRHGRSVNDLNLSDAYAKWADELVGYATALVGPHGADDVVADAFASLLRRERDDAAAERPSRWSQLIEPKPYLFRTVFNAVAMQQRSGGRRSAREQRAAVASGAANWSPPTDALVDDPAVRAAIDALSTQQRGAVYLTYWLDFTITDAAAALDCSAGAVKRHLSRARSTLREALDHKDVR